MVLELIKGFISLTLLIYQSCIKKSPASSEEEIMEVQVRVQVRLD
jgi:hypothetical protein